MSFLFKSLPVPLVIVIAAIATFAQETIWQSYAQAGMNSFRRGDYAEAERLFRAAVGEAGKLNKGDKDSADRMIVSLNGLGNSLQQQGKYAEEEKVSRTLLQLMELARTEDDPEFAIALNNLGLSLAEQKKYSEAEEVHRRALTLREKYEGAKHPNVAVSLINLGKVYQEQARFSQAEALLSRALQILGDIPRDERNNEQAELIVMSFYKLGFIHKDQDQYKKAEVFFKNALEMMVRIKGNYHRTWCNTWTDMLNSLLY